ncbi:hypothetical protein V2G26_007512 [Clonostachys chloroleuca]|uniref:GmrSD restriction endonucleases C-terminal domain-containing protein n=3 Tax=Clonostachys TaxID=110564 RepID=A0A0B7KKL4_BIOOC|nr:unnamed protein product [Clonostachys rosea f. rosea IK726]CAI6095954.1 unnamed protein product [Clonostachys chloroleuca]
MKFLTAIILSAATLVVATPPGIPSASSAKSLLGRLTVATLTDDGSYDRALFPHWEPVPSETQCSAREWVLRRDGNNVKVGSDCYPTSGSWTCPYSGKTITAAGSVDIDHMVPLKNAWISGASTWTTARRETFANDIDHPQLWATDASTNRAKGDNSPDKWKPPLTSFYCTYASSWVAIKSTYSLKITSAEKTALTSMLNTC